MNKTWFDWMWKPKLEITFIDEMKAISLFLFAGFWAFFVIAILKTWWDYFFGDDR